MHFHWHRCFLQALRECIRELHREDRCLRPVITLAAMRRSAPRHRPEHHPSNALSTLITHVLCLPWARMLPASVSRRLSEEAVWLVKQALEGQAVAAWQAAILFTEVRPPSSS